MSNLKITLKSFAAIGALTALGFAAQADDKKPTKPVAEEAKALVTGSGAGKANFQDLQLAKDSADKIGDIKGEAQDSLKLDGVEGEVTDSETKSAGGGGGGKVDVRDISIVKYGNGDDEGVGYQGGDIESEGDIALNVKAAGDGGGLDRLTENVTLNAAAGGDNDDIDTLGEHVGPKAVRGGEDRLTENVTLNAKAAGGGEDRLTENVTLNAAGPTDVSEAETDAAETIGGNDPISGIDIIVKKPSKK